MSSCLKFLRGNKTFQTTLRFSMETEYLLRSVSSNSMQTLSDYELWARSTCLPSQMEAWARLKHWRPLPSAASYTPYSVASPFWYSESQSPLLSCTLTFTTLPRGGRTWGRNCTWLGLDGNLIRTPASLKVNDRFGHLMISQLSHVL